MSEIFGYKELGRSTACGLFKSKKNIWVKFYYKDIINIKMVETQLFLLDKPDLLIKKDVDLNHSLKDIKQSKKKHKRQISDEDFNNSLNRILMKHIFPNEILKIFYYTNNKSTVPIKEKPSPQLSIDF